MLSPEVQARMEKLENMLSKQVFFDWYTKGRYYAYIAGEENPPTKDEILEDLAKMLREK